MVKYHAVKLITTPDVNGNSRRGWMVYAVKGDSRHTSGMLAWIEEGITADYALTELYGQRDAPDGVRVLCVIEVAPREWLAHRRAQRATDLAHLKRHGSACRCYRYALDWETAA